MDKYEYKVRADEIKDLIARCEYAQAAEIADTIDWRRVKSVMMLCTISDLYKINRRYEDARDMLLLAYERRPGGRTICYSLCELSIKMEDYVQAVEYYKEFVQVAPKDSGKFILQYKIYEAQDVSIEERIEVLEELKKRDYREKWAYELAYLYHRIGLATRCVEECDEMILWFGEGKYVIKAMELKKLHEPLTPEQQEKYDRRFGDVMQEEAPVTEETKVYEPVEDQEAVEETADQADDVDIHVKTMDVSEYNTINLQEELAEGLKEVLSAEQGDSIQNPITRSIMAPMMESDTETLDYPEIDEVDENDLEPVCEEMEGSEVFFGETGEIGDLQRRRDAVAEEAIAEVEVEAEEAAEELPEETPLEEIPEVAETEVAEPEPVKDTTAETVMEQMRRDTVQNTEPPKELAGVLSQESDGQLSLVMPEKESIEKQITGQMSIEDILAEWERMKKENEEKRKEEVRQHVLQQTGSMFTEFEAKVRDGLLEQLEKGTATGIAEETAEAIAEEPDEEMVGELVKDFIEEPVEEVVETVAEEAEAEEVVETVAEETIAEEVADTVAEEAVTEEVADTVAEETVTEGPTTETEEPMVEASEEESDETEDIVWDVEGVSEEELLVASAEPEKEAVEREKPKVRALTKEERELYAPFIQSRSAREQLVQAIDNISMAAYTGNIIITGEEGMDTLTLAKNMIREVHMTDSNFSGKVAKISGGALNKKDVATIINDLKNGALIIRNATQMNGETAEALNKALQQETLGIIVVLMDNKKAMNYFLPDYPELRSCFTARMDVEALSNDTLVAFGRQYARELEYSIDEMGMLALHTRIAELQTSDHVVTVLEVKEIVDDAIAHASRKTLGHFFDILFAKRYDDEDMIILGEKDFV